MKIKAIVMISMLLPISALADTSCGPFKIFWKSQDGFARINNEKPQSQKITFLQKQGDYNNAKIQWMTPSSTVGRWLGIDFVARDGKAILNVEVVRMNMDEPRQFWTYDCSRVK